MIAPDSKSYPVTGAALAAGVDPGLACRWLWAERCALRGELGAKANAVEILGEGILRFGQAAMVNLTLALSGAIVDGRVYAPEFRVPR